MGAQSMREWMADLYDLLRDLEAAGQEDSCYGSCFVEDPRDFDPDPECSTEAERALHKADCERYARGESITTKTRCESTVLDEGKVVIQAMPPGYGLGVNTIHGNPEARDMAERLTRICGAIEMWAEEAFPLERAEDIQ